MAAQRMAPCKAKDLRKRMAADMKKLQGRIVEATHRAAELGKLVVYANAPVAFGPLRDSAHVVDTKTGSSIVVDAPHAASVELGSRPHWAPLAPLVAWVQLRGAEGVDAGDTASGVPKAVRDELASMGDGLSTPTYAAYVIAKRIQIAISKNGTKPHFFVRDSVPQVTEILDAYMRSILSDPL